MIEVDRTYPASGKIRESWPGEARGLRGSDGGRMIRRPRPWMIPDMYFNIDARAGKLRFALLGDSRT